MLRVGSSGAQPYVGPAQENWCLGRETVAVCCECG